MKEILINEMRPAVVAHTCYLSYSGGGDPEDQGLRPAQVKKLAKLPSQPISQTGYFMSCDLRGCR
jgi:hypothetical protein